MNYISSIFLLALVASGASLAAQKAKKNEIKDARDKQKYRTIVIDGCKWMADNLNYKMPGSTCYREDEDNCMVYAPLHVGSCAKGMPCRGSFADERRIRKPLESRWW